MVTISKSWLFDTAYVLTREDIKMYKAWPYTLTILTQESQQNPLLYWENTAARAIKYSTHDAASESDKDLVHNIRV